MPVAKPHTPDAIHIAAICVLAEESTAHKQGLLVGELRTLARFHAMQQAGVSTLNSTLATATGEQSTGIADRSASLRRKGLIMRLPGKQVSLTDAGRKVLTAYRRELLRTLNKLQNTNT